MCGAVAAGRLDGRRISIVSRLYAPEPGAASFRLSALARELRDQGARVTVLTTVAPAEFADEPDEPGVAVRRARVLRDRDGYVRGYLQYLSFDIPAFFRVLFGRRPDAIVVEPPPTTGLAVGVAAWLRRVPVVYFAADVWSDAIELTEAPDVVARVVRLLERYAMQSASRVAAVTEQFAERIRVIAPRARVEVVGNGYDERSFSDDGRAEDLGAPYLLYAGTASEVHGAGLFVEALPQVLEAVPAARLVFIGQGAERAAIEQRAAELAPGVVHFEGRQTAERTAEWIRGATATLASMRPIGRYRAFPAKMHASVGCGVPVVYAGLEPGRSFAARPEVGWAVDYDIAQVGAAMIEALRAPADQAARRRRAAWARGNVSLRAVARRVAELIGESLG